MTIRQKFSFSERSYAVIGRIVGLAALCLAAYYAQKALQLMQLTAQKDYKEECKHDLV